MYEYMHRMLTIAETRSQFELYPPGGADVFYPGGRAPRGGRAAHPADARPTLRRLSRPTPAGPPRCRHGAARPASTGATSRRRSARSPSGWEDSCGPPTSRATARDRDAATDHLPGHEILGQGAWTQGPVLMQALGMLATFDLRAMGHNSARYMHVVAEALKLAFADRERLLRRLRRALAHGDHLELISPSYARERAALIRPDRGAPELPPGPVVGRAIGRSLPNTAPRRQMKPHRGRRFRHRRDHTHRGHRPGRQDDLRRCTPSGGVFRKSGLPRRTWAARSAPGARCSCSRTGHPNALVPGKRPRTTLHQLSGLRQRRARHDDRMPGRRCILGPGRSAAPCSTCSSSA